LRNRRISIENAQEGGSLRTVLPSIGVPGKRETVQQNK
jgi:hypothetical protein